MSLSKPGTEVPTRAGLWSRAASRPQRGVARALLALALLVGPAAAWAQTAPGGARVALLIGEGDYFVPPPTVHGDFWPKLKNPPHDVGLVAEKLRQDGFDTTVAIDKNRVDLLKAIADFAAKAARADDAVVYYAGHGFEFDRHNFLVPIDAPTHADAGDLGDAFIDLDVVTQAAIKARHVNIFFLDACRTRDPLVQITGPQKPYVDDVEFPQGAQVAVVYSTARGESAYDSGEATPPPADYSPFAWFVAQYLTAPRTSFGDFFTFVNARVQESTRDWGPQSPYMLTSLKAPFYFLPAGVVAEHPASAAPAKPAGPGASGARGLADSLGLTLDHLAVTDEPVVVADVLAAHSADDLARMARGGDPMAAYLLGYMFEFGRGEQLDLAQARALLEQGAKSGLAPAQLELGWYLRRHGTGPADQDRGKALMEAAAVQGFAKAEAHLADLLMSDGDSGDYQRGVDLYRAAGKKNYPQALYALAVLKDADALARLSALAAKGDMASRQWICDLAGAQGATAFALGECTSAAKAGYSIAQARLAIAYHDGAGAPVDADEARHWSRLALQQPDLRDDLAKQVRAFGY